MRSYLKNGEVKYFIDDAVLKIDKKTGNLEEGEVKLSPEMWAAVKKYYADENGNVDTALALDEASAYYAEALYGTEGAIDLLLGEKPTLKQKILSFFAKSAEYYSTDEKLSREARRHFKKFKAMFDSFAARNQVRSAEGANGKSARRFAAETPIITVGMSDSERATILKSKRIKPTEIQQAVYAGFDWEALERNRKSAVEKPLIKKLRELGYLRTYSTEAIEVSFDFTAAGLRKSMNSQVSDYGGTLADLAKVVLNMQEILDSSVLLEIHKDKAKGTPKENQRLLQTYVLLSAFAEGKYITPVQFEIKQYIDNENRLYLAVALSKIEKTGVMDDTALPNGERTRLLPVSEYSISDFIQKINPSDENFFKYIPDELLTNSQKEAKQRAIAKENAKYRRASAEGISNTSADIEASRASIVMDMDKRYKSSKSEAVSDFFTNFQIQTTNAQAGVEKVLKKNGVKDAEAIVQMARAASNAADSMLGREQYRIGAEKNEDKVKVGKGLSEIMKPIDNATAIEDEVKNLSKDEAEAKREEYRADFFTYLFHEHSVDRMSLRSRQIEWMKEDIVKLKSEVNELEAKTKELAEALGKEKTKEGKKRIRKEIAENRKALDKATNEYAKTKVNIEAAERFIELEATKNDIFEEIKRLKKELEAEGITKDEKKAIADDLKSARNKLGDVKSEMTNLKVIMSDNGFELAVDKPVIGRAVDENGNTVVTTVDDAEGYEVKPYTAEESRAIADELLKKHPEFAKSAEELWGFSRNLNQYRVDTGLITQEQFDRMQKLYPHYVPTYREGSAQGIAALKGKYDVAVKSTVKSATGSVRPLLRPDVIIARQTMETVRAGAINKLARALHDAAGNTEDVTVIERNKVSSEEAAEIDITEVKPKNNRVIFFRDGEKIELQVTKEIFAGFDDFNSKSKDGALIGTAAWITDKYKKLVTSYSPLFIVRNMVRDLQDAGINTKYGKKFAKNYIRAINQIRKNGEYWQLYRAMGGLGSSLFDFDKGYSTTTNKKGLPTKKGMVRKFFQSIENANVFVEQLPRLAEFMSAMQSGKSAEQALLDAADVTTNFGRGGKLVKSFNRTFVPFLNPAVQGFSKIVRMITSIRSMREFSSLLFKCAILGIVPIILNQLMYGDDEDYEKLRESDKENNFLIKLPDNTFIKIPRGRVTSVLAGLYNRPAAAIKGEDVDWGDYLDNVSTQISPVDGGIPRDIFSPIRDIYTNKTWYGTDIENQSDELVAPGERYDESTSEIAKAIGGLLKVSPKKIHYLIDQYSGVVGDIVLPATSNKANRGYFLGNTTIDPTTQNKLSSSFYDAIDGVTYIKNSKSGKYTEEEMLEARAVSKYYNDVKQKISDLNDKKREINNNSKLSNSEKRKQIGVIQTMINEYYKEALTDASAVANVYSTTDTLGTSDIYSNYVTSIKGDENFAETYENLRYIETIKQLYGSETALSEYNKSVYEKSQLYNALGISYDKYYDYYFTTKGIESDVDKQGNTIAGSKKTKVHKAIKRLGGSKNQQILMLYAAGYTVQDGDIKGVSAERAKTILLNAIMKLNVTKVEKEEIAKSFGFKVKNGKILKN